MWERSQRRIETSNGANFEDVKQIVHDYKQGKILNCNKVSYQISRDRISPDKKRIKKQKELKSFLGQSKF